MQSADNSTWFRDKEIEVAAHPKRGRNRSVVDKERRELARKVLLIAHERLESWERVAKFYGLSKAAAYRIAKDNVYRPSKAMLNSIIETDLPTGRRVWIEYRAVNKPAHPHTRRPYWRPCLPVTLTPEQRRQVVDYAASLAGPAGEGGE